MNLHIRAARHGCARVGIQGFGAHRLAGLTAADRDLVSDWGSASEVVIEAHHAMDVGPGEIEDIGDDGDVVIRDVAVLSLERMEQRQEWPALVTPEQAERLGMDRAVLSGTAQIAPPPLPPLPPPP